jgi:hypothetical protein
MITVESNAEHYAVRHAVEHDIDIAADEENLGYSLTPRLARFGGDQTTRYVSADGADYVFSRLDYFIEEHLIYRHIPYASRTITEILQGNRTELAYWPKKAPKKQLTVHRGMGNLVVGNPEDAEANQDGSSKTYDTKLQLLHPTISPTETVEPGRFFTIEATAWAPEPLVVSGLYLASSQRINWLRRRMEQHFAPGKDYVKASEGKVAVPENFSLRYLAPQLFEPQSIAA